MTDRLADEFIKNITVEHTLNKGDNLPFGLFNPETDGNVVWRCGEDADGHIISAFENVDPTCKDRHANEITYEQALETRKILLDSGWQLLKPPKIEFARSDGNGTITLNRKQKRELKRRIDRMQQQNPFDKDK